VITFSDNQTGQKPFRWNDKLPVSDLTFDGDFVVSVL
jgi:hypothetical protein